MPPGWRRELSRMQSLSDAALWGMAGSIMDERQQAELEALAELQEERALTAAEHEIPQRLMQEAAHTQIRRAETSQLLGSRG
mgnify:CR=1 FL=1